MQSPLRRILFGVASMAVTISVRRLAEDMLIVLGHRGDIPRFAQRYAVKQLRYRGARW